MVVPERMCDRGVGEELRVQCLVLVQIAPSLMSKQRKAALVRATADTVRTDSLTPHDPHLLC